MIYVITNLVDGKRYVGWTEVGLARRWTVHKCNSRTGETYLYRAMRKYGTENFKIEELCEGSQDQEIEMIKKLQPEYNMTAGGDGGDTSSSPNFKRAIKEVHAKRSPQDYATRGMLGKKQSKKFREAIKKANCCPVKINGVTYNSVGDAEKANPGVKVCYRLDSANYPEWIRLREKTKR